MATDKKKKSNTGVNDPIPSAAGVTRADAPAMADGVVFPPGILLAAAFLTGVMFPALKATNEGGKEAGTNAI